LTTKKWELINVRKMPLCQLAKTGLRKRLHKDLELANEIRFFLLEFDFVTGEKSKFAIS